MKFLRMVLLAAIVSLPAQRAHAAADVAAGQEKAKVCAACHGENGVSSMPGIPSLAGQQDQFIQWQLVFFRSGQRPNPAMAPIVGELSDEDVVNLGAYFHSLPYNTKVADGAANAELTAKGKTVAVDHRCSSCHKDDFRGERAAPAIADQREDYLVKALTDYRSVTRPSVGVAAMTEAAAGLSDDDIAAVAHYLATLGPPKTVGASLKTVGPAKK
ncbi:MAG: putative cytochrome precursor [Rhodopila sp.]|nr:putative cytochrome precursor [Rhodopila sp.]